MKAPAVASTMLLWQALLGAAVPLRQRQALWRRQGHHGRRFRTVADGGRKIDLLLYSLVRFLPTSSSKSAPSPTVF